MAVVHEAADAPHQLVDVFHLRLSLLPAFLQQVCVDSAVDDYVPCKVIHLKFLCQTLEFPYHRRKRSEPKLRRPVQAHPVILRTFHHRPYRHIVPMAGHRQFL